MFADPVAGPFRNGFNERLEIVALEEHHLAAIVTKQQMFVTSARGDEGLAALRLVHALDDVQFLQFFKRAIDRDQPQGPIFLARRIEDFQRGEGMRGFLDRLHDRAASAGEAVAIFLELSQPDICRHECSLFLKLKIIFNKCTQKTAGRQALIALPSWY